MRNPIWVTIMLCCLLLTSGCGQSGGLYLPQQPSTASTHLPDSTDMNSSHEND